MCLINVFNEKHIEILFQKPERQDRGYGQSRMSMRAKMCLITVFNAKHIEILFQKPERQDRGYGQSRMSMRAKGRSCWAALVSSSLFGNTLTLAHCSTLNIERRTVYTDCSTLDTDYSTLDIAHWRVYNCTIMIAHWTLQSGQCILQTEN